MRGLTSARSPARPGAGSASGWTRATSPIDWDATRAAYLERFGTLIDVQQTKEGESPAFWILCFQGPTRPTAPFVYATFGAPGGELFLASVIPSSGSSTAIGEAAREMPPADDLPELVRCSASRTPFLGLLVLAEEEGSFVVPAADGSPRLVRRVLALTAADSAPHRRQRAVVAVRKNSFHILRGRGLPGQKPARGRPNRKSPVMSKNIFSRRSKRFLNKNLAFSIAIATLALTAAEARAQTVKDPGPQNIGTLVEAFTKSTKYGKFGAEFDATDDINSDTSGHMTQSISAGASAWLFGHKYPLIGFDVDADATSGTSTLTTTILGVPAQASPPGSLTVYDDPCITGMSAEAEVMVGPVPVVMEMAAELCPTFDVRGAVVSAPDQTTFTLTGTPDINVGVTAYIGVGTEVASAGVKGSLTLLDVGTPIKNTMVFAGGTLTDTTTGDVDLSFLNGEFDLYAKAGWGALSVEYDYTLFDWPGFGWTFAGFSDSKPVAKSLALDVTTSPASPNGSAGVLSARYDYSGPQEAQSDVVFYSASDDAGTDQQPYAAIKSTGGSVLFPLMPQLSGRYVRFCITPRSVSSAGATVCSAWSSVGPELLLFPDTGYAGPGVFFPYKNAAPGTCFNLGDYAFNDKMSSFHWQYDASMTSANLLFYTDANCTGSTVKEGITGNASTGSIDRSSVSSTYGSSWNDTISSFRVLWNDTTMAEEPVAVLSGPNAEAHYRYSDAGGLPEVGSMFAWQSADDSAGTNATPLKWLGPQARIHPINATEEGKYLRFCVKASNGITFGDQVCSDWVHVGKLVALYQDANYGGSALFFPYEQWTSGTCVDLGPYGFNDTMTSYRVSFDSYVQPVTDPALSGLMLYKDSGCSGSGTAAWFNTAGGTTSVSNVGSTWNDQVSSFRIAYRHIDAREPAVVWSGASAAPSYTYFDSMGLAESGTTYRWQRADDSAGTNATTVQGYGTTRSYGIQPADASKYLRVCIKPSDGVATGVETCSNWGPVGMLVTLYDQTNYGGTPRSFAYQHLNGTCLALSDAGMNAGVQSAIWTSTPYTQPEDDTTLYGVTLFAADDCTVEQTDDVNEPSELLWMSPTTSGSDAKASTSLGSRVRSIRINYPHFDDASW